jgi:uncharacterized protein (DUF1810 family)
LELGTDIYNLQRFINAQESTFDVAESELAAGIDGVEKLCFPR